MADDTESLDRIRDVVLARFERKIDDAEAVGRIAEILEHSGRPLIAEIAMEPAANDGLINDNATTGLPPDSRSDARGKSG